MADGLDASPIEGAAAGAVVVELPDDHRIVLRQVRSLDADALFDLYDQLDVDERWRRFGSSFRPPASFFEEMARPERRGGARVVAELSTPVTTRIVGEAGYVELANGNGELSMLVGRHWRGWLGAELVHELCAVAAAGGVPNLEADVATLNGPMLSVLHAAGAMVVAHDGWTLERLIIGTTGGMPTWAGFGSSRRVVVEAPGARAGFEADLRDAGFAVLSCHGPRRRHGCPALTGQPCSLAESADVIVVRQPPGDEPWRQLVDAHQRRHSDVPVVVQEASGIAAGRDDDVLGAVRRILDDSGDGPTGDEGGTTAP